ncbi:putative aminopeptidase FrvX [Lysinibacillus sp. RC79]
MNWRRNGKCAAYTSMSKMALSIGIATRYIHSHAGILHRDDYDNAVKLMVEVIKKLDRDAVNKITFD